MALPNKTNLETLDYAYLGAPFVNVEAKSLSTSTLDYAYLGAPFVGTAPAAKRASPKIYYQSITTDQKKTLVSTYNANDQVVYYINNLFRIL